MLKTVRGRYKNGTVELLEKPGVIEGDVLITSINHEEPETIDLQARGITKDEAWNLE